MQSFGIEALDMMLPTPLKKRVAGIFESRSRTERLHSLHRFHHQTSHPGSERLAEVAQISDGRILPWTRACALFALADSPTDAITSILQAATLSAEKLVCDTAQNALAYQASAQPFPQREMPMLSILQKVIILKTVNIFSQTPDDVLADVASLLAEVEVSAGDVIIQKGDLGDSMYIIVSGGMRVHDDDHTLTHLQPRDVFGEMALLASEARSASVTALSDGLLLRLDQEPLYELMEGRSEIARGIITLLSHRLAAANQALRQAQATAA